MLSIVGPHNQIWSPRVSRALVVFVTLAAISGWLIGAAAPVQAADSDPFRVHSHEIKGLVQQVWTLDVGQCENGESDLMVLSTEGGPPSQRKLVTWMPCGASLVPGDPRIIERPLLDEAVIVDIATIPGRSGPQLLTVSAAGIRVEALQGTESPIDFPVPGGLPLPPRPWEIGRVEIVGDWNGNGSLSALVPALGGGWLIDLTSGAARKIEMPIYASYMTHMPFLPAPVLKWMIQEVTWPTLARADDNGDGRLDLFALSRWAIWIYHTGPDGLPSEPSRRLEFVPFDVETERRHEATVNNYFARDIDGDTRADVILSTIGGGLMDGRSNTQIHLNRGTGVTIDGQPDAVRETEGGFSGFNFVDIDGDGREEIIETSIEFGIVQMIRILVTRKAETKLRVLVLDPEAPGGTRTIFEDEFAFSLNFGDASVSGLIPSLGDWNGDGVQDLYVARSDDEIGFRLGSKLEGKPVFGRTTERQPVPLESGESRVADLNGDGLDEIVAFTDTEPDQPLVVLQNLGRLPGTRPELRSVPD
jgi:hypothetical protein